MTLVCCLALSRVAFKIARICVQIVLDLGMETQNVTIRLPKNLLIQAKKVAAERGTSITSLVIEGLTRSTTNNDSYQTAWERQKIMMENARPLRNPSDPMPTREQAYER
jgi:hypothetical protein